MVVNDLRLNRFDWKVLASQRRNSDHCPLTLLSEFTEWGPKPFKAFDDWLKVEEVKGLLNNIVVANEIKSWPGTMKEIKSGLKTWRQEKGEVKETEIKYLENMLKKMDDEDGNCLEKTKVFEQLQTAYQRNLIKNKMGSGR